MVGVPGKLDSVLVENEPEVGKTHFCPYCDGGIGIYFLVSSVPKAMVHSSVHLSNKLGKLRYWLKWFALGESSSYQRG